MSALILITILLPLLGCLFAMASQKNSNNACNVAVFTLITDILVMLHLFSFIDIKNTTLSDNISYTWLQNGNIMLTFGIDAFSLTLLIGIYISIVIGLTGLNAVARRKKSLIILTLFFTTALTALLTAGDMLSFYAFFSAMLLPLFMLIGAYGNIKKNLTLYRFFIYNFIGILALLLSTLLLFHHNQGNLLLSEISEAAVSESSERWIWVLTGLAFISRIPVWPFHYWISSISANIKNPLVYILSNILPLTGLYGFIRFWPLAVPAAIAETLPFIEVFCVVTMVFIALIGLANKEFLHKLFSYSTVYYLLFLLTALLSTDTLKMNIAYALFTFLIVTASLTILDVSLEEKCESAHCEYKGILAYMPRLSKMISLFVLIAVGLPVSALFWNNFILISAIFRESFLIGLWVMAALSLVAFSLLQEIFLMRDLRNQTGTPESLEDISKAKLVFLTGITAILVLSFFNPLWFIF